MKEKDTQIAHLNLQDPDYIPLHFLLAKDILKELEQFRNKVIPNFTACPNLSFSEVIDRYDKLKNGIQTKHDSLSWLNNNVYLLFYEKALNEYQFNNEADGDYFLQRSIQYNETFPNAILLKLNKLLDKNRFEECLSLLNTLYYETEMDEDQEKQAILFTDQFYNKLYHTGDSLVQLEHAAEALELFEILEVFCQNLPSSYCNDDYFHGVMQSKSGIYDSYMAIAKVAEKRGNASIAAHFYQYAQDYLDANPYLKEYEPRMKEYHVTGVLNVANATNVTKVTNVADMKEVAKNETIEEKPVMPQLSPKEIKEKYDKLVAQALALCIGEKLTESYSKFLEAKKLEDCKCFETDFRVEIMIQELSKFGIK